MMDDKEVIDDLESALLSAANRNVKLYRENQSHIQELEFLRGELATLEEENGILEDELDDRVRYRGCLA